MGIVCFVVITVTLVTSVPSLAGNLSMDPPPPLPHRQTLPLSLSQGTDSALMREPPALDYHGRHAAVPFFGFGFSGGTTTDVSGSMVRGLAQQGSLQDERMLRDLTGKTVMPNEVQLGIRLPF